MKLLEYFEDGRSELYDLSNDLGETTDVSETQPLITRRLKSDLAAWRTAVDAQLPEPNPQAKPKTTKRP